MKKNDSLTELTVTVKNAESTYRKKFLIYDTYELNENDVVVSGCIDQALKEFNQPHDSVTIRSVLYL